MSMPYRSAVALLAAAAISTSCSPPPAEPPAPQPATRRATPQDRQAAETPAPSSAGSAAAPPTGAPGPIQTRKTIGKTTQNVLELAAAIAQGGVVVDGAGAPEGGVLGTYAGAYRSSVATIGGLQVEQKMKLHQAEHGTLPETHAEFMKTIIAPGTPDEVSLPMLPYYQEYAFDPSSKQLVVVEFPAKKEQRQQETTGAAGL
ncbi:MAG: hypothetical protein ACKO4Z_14855 [Planctomycetota bacterium]